MKALSAKQTKKTRTPSVRRQHKQSGPGADGLTGREGGSEKSFSRARDTDVSSSLKTSRETRTFSNKTTDLHGGQYKPTFIHGNTSKYSFSVAAGQKKYIAMQKLFFLSFTDATTSLINPTGSIHLCPFTRLMLQFHTCPAI